jgi:hypothetical protein
MQPLTNHACGNQDALLDEKEKAFRGALASARVAHAKLDENQ